ncbi:MAG: glycosyltransferase family 2 protein [Ferruginibacter sp.]|nr:glycosyltransferase [Bacteroidota bacterium]MBX2920440.1 glycosyltransferase [Ferruginibacter sp.]MCB0707903.1 glycosyltransferase [Chitinophagaceae bacterium]MCC7378869.1 glycosyltransferase [Chitinophagaceae bacterium]
MKVSIITATYNSANFLEEAILSVMKQDHHDIEHIIIDGGSTDGTLAIIEKYKNHIAFWKSEPDRGMYDAINKGMRVATGDIIGTLNSDDLLADNKVISDVVNAFKQYKTDTIYGDLVYVKPDDMLNIVRVWKGLPYKRSRYNFGWMPAHPTFYFKRNLLNSYGYYENHYYTAADYEFMARYLFHHRASAYYLPRLVVKMRSGGMSNGNIFRRLRANRRDYLAMKKNHIPFAFIVSVMKPFRKILQYKKVGAMKMLKPQQLQHEPEIPQIILTRETVKAS